MAPSQRVRDTLGASLGMASSEESGQEHAAGTWGRLDPANFRWMGEARSCLMQGAGAGAGRDRPRVGAQIYPKADSDFWGSGIGKRWGLGIIDSRNQSLIPKLQAESSEEGESEEH